MPELFVSWSEYHQLIEKLAVQVHQSGWEFNQIICLARGGLRIGDIFSRLYRQPLGILAATSYGGKGDRVRGKLTFARHVTTTANQMGSHVLLVDDLLDSGVTLKETVPWLKQNYADHIVEVRTAVIWHKACSVIAPDYCAEFLEDNPWIHQPFEAYEHMSLEDLATKLGMQKDSQR
jgi:hypoxanthine phosphoribosyltransferase